MTATLDSQLMMEIEADQYPDRFRYTIRILIQGFTGRKKPYCSKCSQGKKNVYYTILDEYEEQRFLPSVLFITITHYGVEQNLLYAANVPNPGN